ncbi:MAG TPA: hypothetical protein VHV83_20670 [Armatimonadota bacterium]|nr:hypothetical protein [Armatimonadota bacterium]
MKRLAWLLSLAGAILFGSAIVAQAGRIVVNVNMNSPQSLVDVSIQDANVNQVLTTLFNSTGGKYQVRIGAGVDAKIADLQFNQVPFDEAVSTIVNKANPKFTISKQGNTLYSVLSDKSSGISVPAPRQVVNTNAKNAEDDIPIKKVNLPPMSSITTGPGIGLAATAQAGAAGGAAGSTPAAEECYIALITIKNFQVRMLSEALGGDSLPAFDDSSNNNSNNGNGDNYYDDDNYNNNNNNGNNNNNRNNRNNRNNNNNNYNNNNNNNNYNNRNNRY